MFFPKISLAILALVGFHSCVTTVSGSAAQIYPDFWFLKIGHMDGPHTESKAYGISRDGKTAVGVTLVVSFRHAWRLDIDWAMSTDDGIPPLYNELQVQEDLGKLWPSSDSFAYAASNIGCGTNYSYDKVNLILDWCNSTVVGGTKQGQNAYAVQWLSPVLDEATDDDVLMIQDYGGGEKKMKATAVTTDGLFFAGYGYSQQGKKGFWANNTLTEADGLEIRKWEVIIEDFSSGNKLKDIAVEAMSADGTILCGSGTSQNGQQSHAFIAYILDVDADGGTLVLNSTVLPRLSAGKQASAYAMTNDGKYLTGYSEMNQGNEATIWYQDDTGGWAIKSLGALKNSNPKNAFGTGIAYNNDTSVGLLMVVGNSNTVQEDSEAFVWKGNANATTAEEDTEEVGYFYDLEYILTKTGAGEASGFGSSWVLKAANGLSDDGRRIVGWGVNPEQGKEAYVVTGFPGGELNLTGEG